MNKEQAMLRMQNGGQVFRKTVYGRFFYKIVNGELFCRCNEMGGWNPAVSELKETDELFIDLFETSLY